MTEEVKGFVLLIHLNEFIKEQHKDGGRYLECISKFTNKNYKFDLFMKLHRYRGREESDADKIARAVFRNADIISPSWYGDLFVEFIHSVKQSYEGEEFIIHGLSLSTIKNYEQSTSFFAFNSCFPELGVDTIEVIEEEDLSTIRTVKLMKTDEDDCYFIHSFFIALKRSIKNKKVYVEIKDISKEYEWNDFIIEVLHKLDCKDIDGFMNYIRKKYKYIY